MRDKTWVKHTSNSRFYRPFQTEWTFLWLSDGSSSSASYNICRFFMAITPNTLNNVLKFGSKNNEQLYSPNWSAKVLSFLFGKRKTQNDPSYSWFALFSMPSMCACVSISVKGYLPNKFLCFLLFPFFGLLKLELIKMCRKWGDDSRFVPLVLSLFISVVCEASKRQQWTLQLPLCVSILLPIRMCFITRFGWHKIQIIINNSGANRQRRFEYLECAAGKQQSVALLYYSCRIEIRSLWTIFHDFCIVLNRIHFFMCGFFPLLIHARVIKQIVMRDFLKSENVESTNIHNEAFD